MVFNRANMVSVSTLFSFFDSDHKTPKEIALAANLEVGQASTTTKRPLDLSQLPSIVPSVTKSLNQLGIGIESFPSRIMSFPAIGEYWPSGLTFR